MHKRIQSGLAIKEKLDLDPWNPPPDGKRWPPPTAEDVTLVRDLLVNLAQSLGKVKSPWCIRRFRRFALATWLMNQSLTRTTSISTAASGRCVPCCAAPRTAIPPEESEPGWCAHFGVPRSLDERSAEITRLAVGPTSPACLRGLPAPASQNTLRLNQRILDSL